MTPTCRHCGHTNPPGRKYCSQCGKSLATVIKCVNCGSEVAPGDRYCGECGAPVAASPAPASAPEPLTATPVSPAPPGPVAVPVLPPAAVSVAAPVPAPVGAELRQYRGHSAEVVCVAASPDGRYAFSGDRLGGLRMWELDTGTERYRLPGHKSEVLCVAFSLDGKLALSASGFADRTIRIWDTSSGVETGRLIGHEDGIKSAVFAADGRTVLSGSDDKSVRLWDVASGLELLRFVGHTKEVLAVGLMPDGKRALSAANDMTMRVWDMEGDRELSCNQMDAMYEDLVFDCAFSSDGSLGLSTDPEGVQVWEIATGRKLRTLTGHSGNIFGVVFSEDGRLVLSCSGTDFYDEDLKRELGIDNTARLWDVESGRELARLEGHQHNINCVAFVPGGRALTGSVDCSVRLWSLPR